MEKPISLYLSLATVEGLKNTCDMGSRQVCTVCLAAFLKACRTDLRELAGLASVLPCICRWVWVPPCRKNKIHNSSHVIPWVFGLAKAHFQLAKSLRIYLVPLDMSEKVSCECEWRQRSAASTAVANVS